MKKSILFTLLICLIITVPLNAQGFLKKAAGAVKDELFGTKKNNTEPEPACACTGPEKVIGLGGSLNIDYKESNISVAPDGSMLMENRMTREKHIVKDGKQIGPLADNDPRLVQFNDISVIRDATGTDPWVLKYKEYISKSGEKYLINFAGKTYGPYGQINNFLIPMSKDKFAALVTENVVATEADGKKMEQAIENAKTDQEKMELAMKYSQQMAQKMIQDGGPTSITPKLISSLPNTSFDMVQQAGANLNGTAKYDDIILISFDKVYDLQGKQVMTLKPEHAGAQNLFINTANTKYAFFNYGTLTFSDGTGTLSDLLNAREVKVDGKVYVAYLYYSPKNNAIMQCKIPW